MHNYEQEELLLKIRNTRLFIQSASDRLNRATKEYMEKPSMYSEFNKSNAEASLQGYMDELYDLMSALDRH